MPMRPLTPLPLHSPQPRPFQTLDLVDATEVVLDGIFGSGNVVAGLVDLGESGVERRGLAAASGPGDVHDAVWLIDEFANEFQCGLVSDDFIEAESGVGFIENAH